MHTTPVMMNLTRRIRRLAPAAAVAALLLAATPAQAEPARASSTQAWSGVQPIPGANSSNGAGLGVTVLNNRVQLVFKGVTGDQRLFSDSYTAGGGWSGVQPIPGANSSDGGFLTSLNGRLQLVFKGVTGDQRLFSDSYTDG